MSLHSYLPIAMLFVLACSDRPTRSEVADKKHDEAIEALQTMNEQARSYYATETRAELDRRLRAVESTLDEMEPANQMPESETWKALDFAMKDPHYYAYGIVADDAGTPDPSATNAKRPNKKRPRPSGTQESSPAEVQDEFLSLYRSVGKALDDYEISRGSEPALLSIRNEYSEILLTSVLRDESLRPVAVAKLKRLQVKLRRLSSSGE